MKFNVVAGVAAASVAITSFLPVTAGAADLGGWGRGSIKDHAVEPARGPAGPCYVRADVGYSLSQDPNLSWSAVAGVGQPANEAVTNSRMQDTWLMEGGFGCGSGSRGFRGEVAFGYRGQRGIDGMTSPYTDGTTVASRPIHSALTSYTAMVNGFYDLGNFRGFVPYVGAGVGFAYHQMDEYSLPINGSVPYRVGGDNDLSLAWSLMTGLAYQISDRAVVDFGYRYIDMGRAATARVDNFDNNTDPSRLTADNLTAHEFKVGLRYHLGGGSSNCCAAPMK